MLGPCLKVNWTWCNLKNDRMILICFQSKPFCLTVIQACAPSTNAEKTEVDLFYEDLQDLLELIQKKMSFSSQGIEIKSRKLRDTWSNS